MDDVNRNQENLAVEDFLNATAQNKTATELNEIARALINGRVKTLFVAEAEQPLLTKQHVQRGKDRPARDRGHVGDAERGVAAGLAARRVD